MINEGRLVKILLACTPEHKCDIYSCCTSFSFIGSSLPRARLQLIAGKSPDGSSSLAFPAGVSSFLTINIRKLSIFYSYTQEDTKRTDHVSLYFDVIDFLLLMELLSFLRRKNLLAATLLTL